MQTRRFHWQWPNALLHQRLKSLEADGLAMLGGTPKKLSDLGLLICLNDSRVAGAASQWFR